MPASTQNTVRQVPTRSTCPPITGARIGASPLIVAMAEKYAAATFPANMSATTARPTTMPAAPAAPCTNRTAISTVIDVVTRTDHRRDDEHRDPDQQRHRAGRTGPTAAR